MTRKKVIRLVGVIFLALLLILTFFSRTIMNRSLPVVTVQNARSGEITPYVTGTGIVESAGEVRLILELPVQVLAIHVSPGDVVREGEALLDVIVQDDGTIEALREEYAEAEFNYDYSVAAAGGWADNLTQMRLSHEKEQLDKKLAELTAAEALLGEKTLYADCDGVVTELPVIEGGVYAAKAPLCILQAYAESYLLRYTVTKEAAQKLHLGDTAQYTGGDGLLHEAQLLQILPVSGDLEDGLTLVFTVTEVQPGQIMTLTVVQKTVQYECTVPNSAVFHNNDGKAYVFVLATEDSPLGYRYYLERTSVTILESDDARTAIKPDLDPDVYIVTYAEDSLENGMQVRIEH